MDVVATYFELLMGVQQACSMYELYCMISSTATMV